MNKNFYMPYKMEFKEGIFDSFIDATYILTLFTTKRMNSIIEQLKIIKPSRIVYIFFNKGYKDKILNKNDSINDITDTNIHIFHHANENKYKNILVLEDDFIFDKKIKNKDNILNIKNFIDNKQDDIFCYSLGSLPLILYPSEYKNTYLTLSFGAHAHIYNKKTRNHLISKYPYAESDDWEYYTLMVVKRYIYKKPLCYQLFPETENSKNWKITALIFKFINKFFDLKLDISTKGFETYYKIGHNLYYTSILIVMLISYYYLRKY